MTKEERTKILGYMQNSKIDKPPYGDWDIAHDCCIDIIKNINISDTVEVIRCKDCKYYRDRQGFRPSFCTHRDCNKEMPLNGFCSYGQRKEDVYCPHCGMRMDK